MTAETTKAKIKAILTKLEVGEFNLQVSVTQVCELAGITHDELSEVINPCNVRYKLYSYAALCDDVGAQP